MKQASGQRALYYLTIITTTVYIVWRLIFTLPIHEGAVAMAAGIALVSSELLGFLEAFQNFRGLSRHNVPEKPQISEAQYPHVDIFIATHNEDETLLQKTVSGCLFLDYPDKSKVHIYLCDDGKRAEIKALAARMGVGYLEPEIPKDAKAGNLNNALANTNSPLVATLDADMIPMHEFLMETVPYFFLTEDKDTGEAIKIGFIQMPQSFYNADLFQFNLFSESRVPNEQDFFFRNINVRRNYANAPIYAGSNTVISREALAAAGGFATGTITEDMATGIKIQSEGYRCYALPIVVANGLAPTDVDSLMKQRERWGRGCVQVMRQIRILTNPKLSRELRLNYLSCLMYWFSFLRRFIYIMSPILYSVFGVRVVVCSLWQLAVFWLPSYLLYNRMLKYVSGNTRSERWNNIIDTIMFPYLIVPIVLELFGVEKKKFSVTEKGSRDDRPAKPLLKAWPHVTLTALSLLGLFLSLSETFRYNTVGNIVIIYWLAYDLYVLVMAIFFMLGRKNFRNADRYFIKEAIAVELPEREVRGVTSDLSETGFSVRFDFPEFLPEGELPIRIETERYASRFQASLIYTSQVGDGWKYSFRITQMDEPQRVQYSQILYDREPSLPRTTAKHLSLFDDLAINIQKRLDDSRTNRRRLPRFEVKQKVKAVILETGAGPGGLAPGPKPSTESGGLEFGPKSGTEPGGLEFGSKTGTEPGSVKAGTETTVFVQDFNYDYVLLNAGDAPPERLRLRLDGNAGISCRRELQKGTDWLYRIESPEAFVYTDEFRSQVFQWLELSAERKSAAAALKKEAQARPADEFFEMEYV